MVETYTTDYEPVTSDHDRLENEDNSKFNVGTRSVAVHLSLREGCRL